MAATGYTPIQLYYSTTAAAVPTAGNLASGELAINITDGKLYYKSNAGVVTLLAGATAGPAGGSNTQVQFNSSGALAGSANMTFNGTTLVVNDLTDSSLTAGRVTYAGTAGNLVDSANLTFNGTTLTANTIGAFTLGGTIAGGGNQINNVIIGTTTPLAGSFTTLSATGQITGRTSNGAVFVTSNGSDADFVLSLASGLVTQNVTGSLQLQTGGSNRAVISSTGLAVTGTGSYTGNLSVGATSTGKFLAYQATAIQNNQGAYGSSGTFQTGNGTLTLGGGSSPRGIGVLINANRDVGTTLTYGNNFETFGLLAVANVGTGGGYGTTGVAGYAESDGGVYGLRADAKTTSVGGASIAVGLYVGTVTGSSTNYGVYVNDTAASNYFGGSVGVGLTNPSTYGKLSVNGNIAQYGSIGSGNELGRIAWFNTTNNYDLGSIRMFVGAGQINRGEFGFYTNTGATQTLAMYISRTQFVGIGTSTTPAYNFDVNVSAPQTYAARIINSSGSFSTDSALLVSTSTASGARIISAQNSGTEVFSITGAGLTTIGAVGGNIAATSPLSVQSGITVANGLYTFGQWTTSSTGDVILTANAYPANIGSNSNIIFKLGTSGGGGPNEAMRIVSTGYVGIGNNNPTNYLDVSGTIGKRYTSNVTVPANNTATAVLDAYNGQNFGTWLGTNFNTGGPCTGLISITWDTGGSASSAIFSFAKHSGFNGVTITLMSSVDYNGATTVSGNIIYLRNNGGSSITPVFSVLLTTQ